MINDTEKTQTTQTQTTQNENLIPSNIKEKEILKLFGIIKDPVKDFIEKYDLGNLNQNEKIKTLKKWDIVKKNYEKIYNKNYNNDKYIKLDFRLYEDNLYEIKYYLLKDLLKEEYIKLNKLYKMNENLFIKIYNKNNKYNNYKYISKYNNRKRDIFYKKKYIEELKEQLKEIKYILEIEEE